MSLVKKVFASIQTKLVILTLVTAAPFILLMIYTNIRMTQVSRTSAEEHIREQAYFATQELGNDIKNARYLLIGVAEQSDIMVSSAKCQLLTVLFKLRDISINNLVVFRSDGSMVCSGTLEDTPKKINESTWFQDVVRTKIGTVLFLSDKWAGKEGVSLVVEPHKNFEGEVDGVVVLELNQEWVNRTRAGTSLPVNSTIKIVSVNGDILFRDPPIGGGLKEDKLEGFLTNSTSTQSEGSFFTKGKDGIQRIFGFKKLSGDFDGNYLLVGIPESVVLKPISLLNIQNLIFTLAAIILAALLSRIIARKHILKNVNQLVDATKKIAEGNLEARTSLSAMDGELGLLGESIDVTVDSLQKKEVERQQTIELIERERQYFETLVNSNPVAISIWNNDATCKVINPAFTNLFGYSLGDVQGKSLDHLLNTEETLSEGVEITQRVKSGEFVRTITKRKRKNGSLVDVEVVGVAIKVGGIQVGFLGMYHDITELVEARREAESSARAKADFLANMSHEIRTPLNAIVGMTNLLLDTPMDNNQKEFADTIRTSGDDLLTIINDILDFSKIEAGKLELEMLPFDLSDCVISALNLLSPRASEKGLEVLFQIEKDVPPAFITDETRIRQILVNLLGNAIKFTEKGEIFLSVQAEPVVKDIYKLHFSVSDTGIGIPEDRQDKLFKSFSQADASTTRKYGGSGLGLTISKRLAESMGGTMWFESKAGEGSTFHITIKALVAESTPKTIIKDSLTITQGKTILIVDDNEKNRLILTHQVESWKMNAIPASSGFQALEILSRIETIDAAILDMQMPEMDGTMLAQAIRDIPGRKKMPLILLTSFGRKEKGDNGRKFSAQLSKPVRPSLLLETLLSVFSNQPVVVKENLQTISEFDRGLAEKHPLRILLAEDNVVNQKVATRMLERLGYRIDIAANGLEVLQALERKSYDLVFMDVQMPEMDGLEAARQIQKRIPIERIPKIIAMTAHALQGDRERFLAEGMDDYLCKPVLIADLIQAIKGTEPLRQESVIENPLDEDQKDSVIWEKLDQYYRVMGDEADEFIAELIDTFLPNAHKLVLDMNIAALKKDRELIHRAAHSLKSSSASLGAMHLSILAREFEFDCQQKLPAKLKERIGAIDTELHKVEGEFTQFLRSKPIAENV